MWSRRSLAAVAALCAVVVSCGGAPDGAGLTSGSDAQGGGGATSGAAGSDAAHSSATHTSTGSGGAGEAGGGAGGGEACDDASQCPSAPCREATCDHHVCVRAPAPRGSPSAGCAGVCDGDGACVECVDTIDCAAVECNAVSCEPSSNSCVATPASGACGNGLQCQGGVCAGCTQDSQCTGATACQTNHCNTSTGACQPTAVAEGTTCSGPGGAKYCDQAGQCTLQCVTVQDCGGAPTACQLPSCSAAGQCTIGFASSGTSCTGGGVCDDAGNCVDCNTDTDCAVCTQCDTTNHTCTIPVLGVSQEPGVCDDDNGNCGGACACSLSHECKLDRGQTCLSDPDCASGVCSTSLNYCR